MWRPFSADHASDAMNLICTWLQEKNGASFEKKAYAQEHQRHKEEVQDQTQNKGPGSDSRRLEVRTVGYKQALNAGRPRFARFRPPLLSHLRVSCVIR